MSNQDYFYTSQLMTWKTLSTKTVYQNRFMTVTDDQILTDFGEELNFGIVHKEPGVCIVSWDGEFFTLVSQYRYPVGHLSWEFPAGHYEHSSIEESARAELREEAGLLAKKLEKIGEFDLAPGHHTQIIHFYLATDLTQVEQELEPAEQGMKIKKITHQELNQLIKKGEIRDSLTIAALKFFELSQES